MGGVAQWVEDWQGACSVEDSKLQVLSNALLVMFVYRSASMPTFGALAQSGSEGLGSGMGMGTGTGMGTM